MTKANLKYSLRSACIVIFVSFPEFSRSESWQKGRIKIRSQTRNIPGPLLLWDEKQFSQKLVGNVQVRFSDQQQSALKCQHEISQAAT